MNLNDLIGQSINFTDPWGHHVSGVVKDVHSPIHLTAHLSDGRDVDIYRAIDGHWWSNNYVGEVQFRRPASFDSFHGLGAFGSGLGFDASAHNVLLKHALTAVTESAARGQEALKRKSCDSAFADLLTVKEFMGKARAHATSMGDDPSDAVEPVRIDAMNLSEAFRKKCLRKR